MYHYTPVEDHGRNFEVPSKKQFHCCGMEQDKTTKHVQTEARDASTTHRRNLLCMLHGTNESSTTQYGSTQLILEPEWAWVTGLHPKRILITYKIKFKMKMDIPQFWHSMIINSIILIFKIKYPYYNHAIELFPSTKPD